MLELGRVRGLEQVAQPLVEALPSLRLLSIGDCDHNAQLMSQESSLPSDVRALYTSSETTEENKAPVDQDWGELRGIWRLGKQR